MGPVRLETELVFLPLIETLLDDVKAVVRESDGGNPKEARKAALKHFGELLTIKRKISGGTSKLKPLREAIDRLHGALKKKEYATLDDLAKELKTAYDAVLAHKRYFNRGIGLAEGGLAEVVQQAHVAFIKPFYELRQHGRDTYQQVAKELHPSLPAVLDKTEQCVDELKKNALVVESGAAANRRSQRRGHTTTRRTLDRLEKAATDLVATARRCIKEIKKAMPKDFDDAVRGRIHRALLEETGVFWPPVLHAAWLRTLAIQYFKVILLNAQGLDAGDKKLRSPHVLDRGGKTVDALKEMLRDECVPFNEDYSGNCKLKQPYVYRVRKFLQIDFQKLFPDQTTKDLLEHLRIQLLFLAETFDDPKPAQTYEKSCSVLSRQVEDAAKSAEVAFDLLWPPMRNTKKKKSDRVFCYRTQSAHAFFDDMVRTFKLNDCCERCGNHGLRRGVLGRSELYWTH